MDMLTIAMLFFQLAVTLGVGLVGLGDTDLLSSLIPGSWPVLKLFGSRLSSEEVLRSPFAYSALAGIVVVYLAIWTCGIGAAKLSAFGGWGAVFVQAVGARERGIRLRALETSGAVADEARKREGTVLTATLARLEAKMDRLEGNHAAIRADMADGFGEVRNDLVKAQDERSKIAGQVGAVEKNLGEKMGEVLVAMPDSVRLALRSHIEEEVKASAEAQLDNVRRRADILTSASSGKAARRVEETLSNLDGTVRRGIEAAVEKELGGSVVALTAFIEHRVQSAVSTLMTSACSSIPATPSMTRSVTRDSLPPVTPASSSDVESSIVDSPDGSPTRSRTSARRTLGGIAISPQRLFGSVKSSGQSARPIVAVPPTRTSPSPLDKLIHRVDLTAATLATWQRRRLRTQASIALGPGIIYSPPGAMARSGRYLGPRNVRDLMAWPSAGIAQLAYEFGLLEDITSDSEIRAMMEIFLTGSMLRRSASAKSA